MKFITKTRKSYTILIWTLLFALLWTIISILLDLLNLMTTISSSSSFTSPTITTTFWKFSINYYYSDTFYAQPIDLVILAFSPIICILALLYLKSIPESTYSPTTNVLFPTTHSNQLSSRSSITRLSHSIANVIGIFFALIYYSIFVVLIYYRYRHSYLSFNQRMLSYLIYSIFMVIEVLFYRFIVSKTSDQSQQLQPYITKIVIIGALRFVELILLNTIAFWPDMITL